MSLLRISLLQKNLIWENQAANLSAFTQEMTALKGKTDVIILPEMFTTGFTMNAAAVAEKMDGTAISWMRKMAAELDAVVTGSLIVTEQGQFYNRLIWMQPDGVFSLYDKRHLFTLANEQATYQAGTEKQIVHWKGWRICPLICYDLRFPVWSRNTEIYDLLLYVANWPKKRSHHWNSLLVARAIENQCFTVGVNRVGTDENDLQYSGDSQIIDYAGVVMGCVSGTEASLTLTLDKIAQQKFREKLNFLPDADTFVITP